MKEDKNSPSFKKFTIQFLVETLVANAFEFFIKKACLVQQKLNVLKKKIFFEFSIKLTIYYFLNFFEPYLDLACLRFFKPKKSYLPRTK